MVFRTLSLLPASVPKRHACVGLDITPGRLCMAVMRRQGGRLHLQRLSAQALEDALVQDGQIGNFELLAHACRQLLQSHAPDAGAMAMAVPARAARAIRLVLPASSNEVQRLAQVRAGLAAHGLALEEQALDYQVLGPRRNSPGDVDVMALGIPALMVEDRLALADALALPLNAMPADGWCLPRFLREADGDHAAVLHLGASGNWLSPHAAACLPLAWRSTHPLAALVQELAPLLRPAPRRLLLTGDYVGLDAATEALRKYAGLDAAIPALPPGILVSDMYAAALRPAELAPFHCALALAAEGLA